MHLSDRQKKILKSAAAPSPPDGDQANQQTVIEDQPATVADPASGDQDGAVPGAGGEQVESTTTVEAQPPELSEPPEGENESQVLRDARAWGRGLNKDLREAKPVVEEVNSLGGLELVKSVAAPILAPEFNADGTVDSILETRGVASYPKLLRAMIDRADCIAEDPEAWKEFSEVMWSAFDRYGALPAVFKNPALLGDEGLRSRVQRFLDFEKTGVPAGANAPAQISQTGSDVPPDNSDLDELELPDSVRAEIVESRKLRPLFAQLQTQVDELKGVQESEKERQERERREAQETAERDRQVAFMSQASSPSEKLIQAVQLSTNPDPQKAAAENEQIRHDISTIIKERIRADATLKEAYQHGYEAHSKGDRIKAAPFIQTLKQGFDRITKEVIAAQTGRRLQGVREEKQQVDEQPKRTVITGQGGAVPVSAPSEPAGQAFDMDRMLRKAQQMG